MHELPRPRQPFLTGCASADIGGRVCEEPVIYYGDEQGFTGDGGDKDAREDMFANHVPSYADNDLIGTNETSADDNFDESHPLFQAIRDDAKLYHQNVALRSGAQIFRYSSEGPGVFAFSRIDRDERIEYVVALNNSETSATASVPTYSPTGVKYKLLVDTAAPNKVTTGSDGSLSLTVPPLGFVIYRASARVQQSDTAPGIDITDPQTGGTVQLGTNTWDGQKVLDRVEVAVDLDTDQYAEVRFAVREGDGDWTPIGTDDNAPYRVFYNAVTSRATRTRGSRSARS
jgi:alpha-amylase